MNCSIFVCTFMHYNSNLIFDKSNRVSHFGTFLINELLIIFQVLGQDQPTPNDRKKLPFVEATICEVHRCGNTGMEY